MGTLESQGSLLNDFPRFPKTEAMVLTSLQHQLAGNGQQEIRWFEKQSGSQSNRRTVIGVSLYICISVCLHVISYDDSYSTYRRTYVHGHAQPHVYTHAHLHSHMYTHMFTCTHTCTLTCSFSPVHF